MKRRFLLALLLVMFTMTFGSFVTESQARLSNNNRRAVVLECFYALRPSADGSCDKTINGNCVSNWNYINNDTYAYGVIKNWYSCYSSEWVTSGDGSACYNYNAPASFYSNVASYGYGTFGGSYGSIGRGGQCKYFANLILYRSGSDQRAFPNYATMFTNVETDMTKAVQGDVLITMNEGSGYNIPHTAIVVELKSDDLDVIDANYLKDLSGTSYGREVIGRHLITWSYLQGHSYRIWRGASYYSEPYIP